ncbi:MAG: hypothetical protein ACREEP_10700, partial [Dongiaceae bacterium]
MTNPSIQAKSKSAMNEREEAAKWLKLGYETYGPAGARAMAQAMGLRIGVAPVTTADRRPHWTATHGSVTLAADENDSQAPTRADSPKFRTPKPPAACPASPPRGARGWRSYGDIGDPDWFHCGYEGYLEDRDPSPDWPVAECFYDEEGRL